MSRTGSELGRVGRELPGDGTRRDRSVRAPFRLHEKARYALLWLIGIAPIAAAQAPGGARQLPTRPLLRGDVTTTIVFDDLPAGTRVTTQYHAQGVDFLDYNASSPEGGLIPDIATAGAGAAHSGTQVLNTYQRFGEFFTSWAGGSFTTTVSSVSMRVGFFASGPPGDTARVLLRARDASHVQVGQAEVVVTEGAGFHTLLSVSSTSANIAYFLVETALEDSDDAIGIDDLTFVRPGGPAPDFGLAAPAGVLVLRGGNASVPVTITRFNGSTGPIDFSVTGLPPGVTGSFAPNPADSATVLSLVAALDAPLNPGTSLTIVGSPSVPSAGAESRTTSTFLVVDAPFDVVVRGGSSVSLPACTSRSVTVDVVRNLSFVGAVSLSVKGLPAGIQAVFDPATVDFADGGVINSSTLTLTNGTTIQPQATVRVVGTSPGAAASASFTLELPAGTTRIRVIDDINHAAPGAEVYLNGTRVGTTDSAGVLELSTIPVGSSIVARRRVLENRSPRGDHAGGSTQPWNYRVYQTSLTIENDGSVSPFLVSDPCAEQVIAVRRQNALFGLHIVASLNWDASTADMAEMQQRLLAASQFLYNATDGQFLIERLVIADDSRFWGSADYGIHAAPGGARGIRPHIVGNPPRQGFLAGSSWMSVSRLHDAGLFCHEFGHYGFGLGDEYADDEPMTRCTAALHGYDEPFGLGGSASSCLMWSNWHPPKFCSAHPVNKHIGGHRQDTDCWSDIAFGYANPLWQIRTPFLRGAIVGTVNGNAIPVAGWLPEIVSIDSDSGPLCPPELYVTTFDGEVRSADVHSIRSNSIDLWHGNTKAIFDNGTEVCSWDDGVCLKEGEILLRGLHPGDTLVFYENAFWYRVATHTVNCNPIPSRLPGSEPVVVELEPSPFQLLGSFEPGGNAKAAFRVRSARGPLAHELAAAPEVTLFRDAAPATSVAMSYEPTTATWVGSISDLSTREVVTLMTRATDLAGNVATSIERVGLSSVDPAAEVDLFSSDGRVSLTVPAGALPAATEIAFGPSNVPWPAPGPGFEVVGRPYRVASSGLPGLAKPCRLRFELAPSDGVPGTAAYEPESFAIWQQVAGTDTWISLGGVVVPDPVGVVGIDIRELGTFALVAHVQRPAVGPDCTDAVATVPMLWPPNLKFVKVGIAGLPSVAGDLPVIEIVRVTSNEPSGTTRPDDRATPDAVVRGPAVFLRAERDPAGIGRTYRIHFRATDSAGLQSEESVAVCVPLDLGTPCIDDGRVFDPTQ